MLFDDNTINSRPSGFDVHDQPDYADHANEIINHNGSADANLTVSVYNPQGVRLRFITLNNFITG